MCNAKKLPKSYYHTQTPLSKSLILDCLWYITIHFIRFCYSYTTLFAICTSACNNQVLLEATKYLDNNGCMLINFSSIIFQKNSSFNNKNRHLPRNYQNSQVTSFCTQFFIWIYLGCLQGGSFIPSLFFPTFIISISRNKIEYSLRNDALMSQNTGTEFSEKIEQIQIKLLQRSSPIRICTVLHFAYIFTHFLKVPSTSIS